MRYTMRVLRMLGAWREPLPDRLPQDVLLRLQRDAPLVVLPHQDARVIWVLGV